MSANAIEYTNIRSHARDTRMNKGDSQSLCITKSQIICPILRIPGGSSWAGGAPGSDRRLRNICTNVRFFRGKVSSTGARVYGVLRVSGLFCGPRQGAGRCRRPAVREGVNSWIEESRLRVV